MGYGVQLLAREESRQGYQWGIDVDVYTKALLLLVVVIVGGTIAYVIARKVFQEARDSRKRTDAHFNKPAVYQKVFDGREVVTFEANRATLPADMVVEAAAEYGYMLTNRAVQGRSQHLVFTKRS